MPTILTEAPSSPQILAPPRKRWTRSECATLEESGLFDQQRVELIAGELISKMGKRRPHVNAVWFTCLWLAEAFGKRFVNPEAPIDVAPEDNPTNEPEPDVIVLNRDLSNFRSANPRPEDLHLVVEVADSTLNFDLTVKAALYARAGIMEYWVVDVPGRRVIVHREPKQGSFVSIVAYCESEPVAPIGAPQSEFRAAYVLDDRSE